MTTAHRHGGPDAGWYRPDGHGWQRISDGEVSGHGDAAHFMSDPNGRHDPAHGYGPEHRAARAAVLAELTRLGKELGPDIPPDEAVAACREARHELQAERDHGQKPPAS